MRQAHLHRYRQIDDDIVGFGRLQYVQNRITDLQGIFRFRTGKAFGRIFKAEVPLIFVRQFFHKLGAVDCDFLDFFFGFAEYLLPLGDAYRIIEVNDRAGCALAGVKGLADDMLPALGEHLNRYILRDHVVVDQRAQKFIFGFAGGREAHFDFLEADVEKNLVIFQLFLEAHGNDEALVAVPHIHTAP